MIINLKNYLKLNCQETEIYLLAQIKLSIVNINN